MQEKAELLEVHLCFVIRSTVASLADKEFHIVMSPEGAMEYLKSYLESLQLEENSLCREKEGYAGISNTKS